MPRLRERSNQILTKTYLTVVFRRKSASKAAIHACETYKRSPKRVFFYL